MFMKSLSVPKRTFRHMLTGCFPCIPFTPLSDSFKEAIQEGNSHFFLSHPKRNTSEALLEAIKAKNLDLSFLILSTLQKRKGEIDSKVLRESVKGNYSKLSLLILSTLQERQVDINQAESCLLGFAISNKNIGLVKAFIEKGIHIQTWDLAGVVNHNNIEMVKVLLQSVRFDLVDLFKSASDKGHEEIAILIFDHMLKNNHFSCLDSVGRYLTNKESPLNKEVFLEKVLAMPNHMPDYYLRTWLHLAIKLENLAMIHNIIVEKQLFPVGTDFEFTLENVNGENCIKILKILTGELSKGDVKFDPSNPAKIEITIERTGNSKTYVFDFIIMAVYQNKSADESCFSFLLQTYQTLCGRPLKINLFQGTVSHLIEYPSENRLFTDSLKMKKLKLIFSLEGYRSLWFSLWDYRKRKLLESLPSDEQGFKNFLSLHPKQQSRFLECLYEEELCSEAEYGKNTARFKLLIENGAVNINCKHRKEVTPLHFAMRNPNKNMAFILLERPEIDVMAQNKGRQTALHFLLYSNPFDESTVISLIEKLIQKNPSILEVRDSFEKTPLDVAKEKKRSMPIQRALQPQRAQEDTQDSGTSEQESSNESSRSESPRFNHSERGTSEQESSNESSRSESPRFNHSERGTSRQEARNDISLTKIFNSQRLTKDEIKLMIEEIFENIFPELSIQDYEALPSTSGADKKAIEKLENFLKEELKKIKDSFSFKKALTKAQFFVHPDRLVGFDDTTQRKGVVLSKLLNTIKEKESR